MNESKVKDYFSKKISENNLSISNIDQDGLYHIKINGLDVSVSLENIIKNSIRDNSFSPVDAMVESLKIIGIEKNDYSKISNLIYPSLENVEVILDKEIIKQISKQTKLCFNVFVNNQLIYVNESDLQNWKITTNELEKIANTNLDKIYERSIIKNQNLDGHYLYYIESDFPLKSTIIFSPKFKSEYLSKFKEDIYAVLPARDFCYFFSGKDKDYFLQRIGGTVLDEYNKSGYSITKEIFVLNKDENRAIGSY